MKTVIQSKTGTKVVNLNRRKAIKERCLNCSAWSPKKVEQCHFTDCPLYPYRSGKGKQDAKERNKAIRAYCLWCCSNQPKEVRLCPSGTCSLFFYRGSSTYKKQPLHPPSFAENTPYRGQNMDSDTEGDPQEAYPDD